MLIIIILFMCNMHICVITLKKSFGKCLKNLRSNCKCYNNNNNGRNCYYNNRNFYNNNLFFAFAIILIIMDV